MAVEANLIKKADLARVREVDFAERFAGSVNELTKLLGIARKLPKREGSVIKATKATGVLAAGNVAEGEVIPLSKYSTAQVTLGEIVLKKWRKSTSAEAIVERGYDQAVGMATDAMLADVQRSIRTDFASCLAAGTGTASGVGLQAALADAWGKLTALFEDAGANMVFLVNPLDAADWLAGAQIPAVRTFGLTALKNFLGLGTLILTTAAPKGTFYATAEDNLTLCYIPVNGAGLGEAFTFTSDETGLIGIHEEPNYERMTAEDTVTAGISIFAERLDGVVVGTISAQ